MKKQCRRCKTTLSPQNAKFCYECGLAVNQSNLEAMEFLKRSWLNKHFHSDYLRTTDMLLEYGEGLVWLSDRSHTYKSQLGLHIGYGSIGYILVTLKRIIQVLFNKDDCKAYGLEGSASGPVEPITSPLSDTELKNRYVHQVLLNHLHRVGYVEFDVGTIYHSYSRFSLYYSDQPEQIQSQFFIQNKHLGRNLRNLLNRHATIKDLASHIS